MPHLLCFGFGFSARILAARMLAKGWEVSATSRSAAGLAAIAAAGAHPLRFGEPLVTGAYSHIVSSAPPDDAGDPVLRAYPDLGRPRWAAYLSTTGVYGDRGGGWVGEDSPLTPSTERGARRLAAEEAWLKRYVATGLPVHIFRLAGIYGSGRNQLQALKDGAARRVIKPGQIFSRIHVDDISGILEKSMDRPSPGSAYNVCDDEPCPPEDVISYGARLLGLPPPPEVAFDAAGLSPMARSFYAESKRVSNRKVKEELGYAFLYPTYREGLSELVKPFLRQPTEGS